MKLCLQPSKRGSIPGIRGIALVLVIQGAAIGSVVARSAFAAEPCPPALTPEQQLGQLLFNDVNLSVSRTQSCASCHQEQRAFTGNNAADPFFPVALGALPTLVGVRNTPTAKYAAFTPTFSVANEDGEWVPNGGQFLDGRANTLAAQAEGPFVNPREMAMPSRAAVIERIREAEYASLFEQVFGAGSLDDVDLAYGSMALAIEAFERTEVFSPFSSKFDAVLRGEARFTREEARGFALFKDPAKGNCLACHVGDEASSEPAAWLFTDFTYDNLGVPRNPQIPDNADPAFFDLGLCAQPGLEARLPDEVGDKAALIASLCGAFKVPSLRNVALTAPYMHNGYFRTLREVVEFYVTRDTNPERWYPVVEGSVAKFDDLPSEYLGNVNTSEAPYDRAPGQAPRLTPREIDALVAFLRTLSDGFSD
ncbi:MAG TPA: cytochrome c peroxidase [Polyangiaceae bacterium]|nr:cytochrome c peroxidase [Polyangiaceae bacterium]